MSQHYFKLMSQDQPKNIFSQQGWTIWSMMFVLSVLFVMAYIGMQLVPIYSANSNVKNAMYVSLEDKDLRKMTRVKVVRGMKSQMYLDGSADLFDFKEDLKLSRSKNTFTIEVTYEQEVPLIANLVLVAKFNPKVECELSGRCEK